MDCQTGEIHSNDVLGQLIRSGALFDRTRFRPMAVAPTAKQMARKPPRIGRNEPCPCGSGLKFKRCCLRNPSDERFAE